MSHPVPGTAHQDAAPRARFFLAISSALLLATGLLLLPATSGSRPRSAMSSFGLQPSAARLPRRSTAPRYWHTAGSRILDGEGNTVRISGLNWSGFETTTGVVGGLEQQDYRAILHTIHANGYNTVRIPFSNQMIESPTVPAHIAFHNAQGAINSDLDGLDSLAILDRIVAAAGEEGLRIILDNHRSEAGSSAEESGLWYTDRYPETAWIADWGTLARRYANNPTVVGVDLRNEPHNAGKGGACWSCGGADDWHLAAERAGNAVLRANPRLLIFVEGTDAVDGNTTWWGGNLAGVRHAPVHLAVPGRLVYSAHVYGPTEYPQSWFNAGTSPASLAALWRRDWAYIGESGLAPVFIGEFGTSNDEADIRSSVPGSEGQWFSALVGFLQAHPDIGWTYWGANGEDRYALLDGSYSSRPTSAAKAMALASISAPLVVGPADAAGTAGEFASAPQAAGTVPSASVSMTVVPVNSATASSDPASSAAVPSRLSRADLARAWRTAPPAAPDTAIDAPVAAPSQLASSAVSDVVAEQVRRANRDALARTGSDRR